MVEDIKHVAIIMDGNGRWAFGRNHSRGWGHIRGSKIVSDIVEEAINQEVKCLTLFAFSTENWSRPMPEIKIIFALLKKFLVKEREKLNRNRVRFQVIGDTSHLPPETQSLIAEIEKETSQYDRLVLSLAFNYGGRKEIIDSFNQACKNRTDNGAITQEEFEQFLPTYSLGEVDLLIRTGGEFRISNFLLWQSAYAEFFFTKTMWPSFNRKEFVQILDQVRGRTRRFGNVSEVENLKTSVNKAVQNFNNFQEHTNH